jgi:hypothetical protein
MSIAKKLALLVLPAVALMLPLTAASSAQAYDHHDHHDYHGHVVHYDHFGYWPYVARRVVVSPQIVIGPTLPLTTGVVTVQPVSVFYRTNVLSPWLSYGSYSFAADAQVAADSLRLRGLEVFIR